VAAGPEPCRQTWRVADFARTLRWEELSAGVRSQAIRCVLDLCGAAVAGSRTEAAQTAATYALYAHGNGSSTIIGTGANSTPVGAALANGFAASALDIDDGYRPVKGHPGAVVFPAGGQGQEGRHEPSEVEEYAIGPGPRRDPAFPLPCFVGERGSGRR
jgi:hypothetical protein